MATSAYSNARPPFYRDTHILGILVQLFFIVVLVLIGWFLYRNMTDNLAAINSASGGRLSWNFFGQTAGFEISEGPAFRPEESYWRAYVVGLINTLRVCAAGVILATILGVFTGIARVSNNWLLSKIALTYVEIIRSTPLLVQLLFWYFGVIAALPDVKAAAEWPGLAFLSNRGIYVTWPVLTVTGAPWLWWLLAGVGLGLLAAWLRRRQLDRRGLPGNGFLLGVVVFFVIAIVGFFAAFSASASHRTPPMN
ncbi:MAG: ABC transporter permease subunit [Anaerolineales bacterium]|nr:ABC transporter permease subunit [Anaerolineales bacterium]